MPYGQELGVAVQIALDSGVMQMEGKSKLTGIDLKEDLSPVTDIDRRIESFIREKLSRTFPQDGIQGEEAEEKKGQSERIWIIDPLDGTRPYIRGLPTHSVLIALEEAGEVVLGVIHLPAMNLTCTATKGGGAYLNGTAIQVSKATSFTQTMGSAIGFIQRADDSAGIGLFSLIKQWDYAYGFMDAYSYVCVASGKLDIVVSILDKPWDCAAAACIIQEAGGVFSDINGKKSIRNGSFIATNKTLHEQALRYFS